MLGWFPFFTDFPMTKPHWIAVWINHEKQLKTQVLSVQCTRRGRGCARPRTWSNMIEAAMSSLQESDRGTNGGLKLLLLPKLEHKSLENKQCMGSTLTVTSISCEQRLDIVFQCTELL